MRKQVSYLVLISILSLAAKISFAQETTATLSGNVADDKGAAVAGATIKIRHEPTGTSTLSQTNSKGIFVVPNLKVGGPYTISVSNVGFEADTLSDVTLVLGENPDVNINLKSSTQTLTEVTVTTARRLSGSGTIVGRDQLRTLPTIGRSISDFTRLTPQSNNNSFAGSNFRYNNFTMDGAINNDAIGFSNSFGGVSGGGQSGTAGSGTRTNPYSLETIQEVQVQLAPYDVKIGNFTGGSVNAVTKSGTNEFHGSVYGYGRNSSLVGKSVDGLKTSMPSDFHDYQTGFTFGGPIIKNKLFFFVNGELTRQQIPTFYNAGDPGAAMSVAEAQQIVSFLKTNYNYDPGTYGAYNVFTKSNKVFGKIDWNINSSSSLMVRGIYTEGWGDNLERTSTNFQFSSTDFTQYDKNVNLVAELKTKFSNNVNNQAIVSYINVHEYRTFPESLDANGNPYNSAAPLMDIDNGRIWLGTWREAAVYNMHQKTFEFTDNVTYTTGNNKFTFGTHNEFYNLTYGFLNSWNGRWEYAGGLSAFLGSTPSRIRGVFPFDDAKNEREDLYNNLPGSNYKVNLTSVYAEDEISVNKKLKVTPGVRVDYPFLSQKFPIDTALNKTPTYVSANPTYSHTPYSDLNNDWLGKATVSPRVGFTYNASRAVTLRGGSGIFVGRMPFAWMGYASTLTGTTYGNIDYKPGGKVVPLAIDPTTLKDTVTKYGGAGASSTRELDIIDNNFKLPTIWRSNVAVDFKFGNGYKATFDVMYTKTIEDVQFQQINIKDSAQYYSTGPTETPYYVGGKVNSQYSNIYFLTNTKLGYRYNLTAQLSKVTNNVRLGVHSVLNLSWMAAYTYGESKDVANGIRNSFQSNYEVNPAINPENPGLAYSNFDLRHHIVAQVTTNWIWSAHNATSLAFFYSGQSGSPYSVIYTNAPFGNSSNAPLPFIPADQSQIHLADYTRSDGTVYTAAQQWTDLNNFINNDSYLSKHRGQYADRNALRTPWNHELDMKIMHEFKFSGSKSLQISLDVFNVLNLLSNDWGHITFVTNVNNYTVNFLRFATDANGLKPGSPASGYVPTFNYLPPAGGSDHYYTNDPINSRWQAQLGLKFNF
jgi:hypothetical protein